MSNTSLIAQSFTQEKFFNNSHSYFGTFAYEKARITSKMDRQ